MITINATQNDDYTAAIDALLDPELAELRMAADDAADAWEEWVATPAFARLVTDPHHHREETLAEAMRVTSEAYFNARRRMWCLHLVRGYAAEA